MLMSFPQDCATLSMAIAVVTSCVGEQNVVRFCMQPESLSNAASLNKNIFKTNVANIRVNSYLVFNRIIKYYVISIHYVMSDDSFNPFPHTAILQQTTFRKILNVHSAERNEHFLSWKALKTLSQCFQLST